MSEFLIFGGTTEGRELTFFCAEHDIPAAVSVATEYGASLFPEQMHVLTGRLDAEQISALLSENRYSAVIDATHPYAEEATQNIRTACNMTATRYFRLIRQASEISGNTVSDMTSLLDLLNQNQKIVLSTLGSKSIPILKQMQNYQERLWVRILSSAEFEIPDFPAQHIIAEKAPFSVEQNIHHIRQSGAEILLTKESGAVGGYPEKIEAAKQCGIEVITLLRPAENGRARSRS